MTYKSWPTADQQHDEQGRTDVVGAILIDPATGQPYNGTGTGGGGGGAVTVADGADVAQGTTTDAANANTVIGQLKQVNAVQGATNDSAATSDTGTFSLIALIKRLLQSLTTGNTNTSTSATNTGNTATVLGTTADAAVTGDTTGTISAKQRGLTKILADVWDSTNHLFHFNLKQVGGNAVAPGNNAVPILNSAATGYVSAYGSNAANTTAATDYSFKWGVSGTTQVNHVMIQNNTGANISWDLDTATSAGSPILATGQTLFLDVQTSVLHLQSAAQQNVNGTSASNIVVRGWL